MFDARSQVRLRERLATYQQHLRLLIKDGKLELYEIVSFP
jgi:hypothetical protein